MTQHHQVTMEPGAMSIPTFAAWASISEPWAWKLVHRGEVRSVKLGRRRLVPFEAARAWLASGEAAA